MNRMILQLTVFIENEKGALASVCRSIADAGINMHTLFIADTQEFGVARIFCDTPHAAAESLQEMGYQAVVTPVLGVRVPNHKGGLADMLELIDEKGFSIEYGYCYAVNNEYAIDVLKVDDDSIEGFLKEEGYEIVESEEVYQS